MPDHSANGNLAVVSEFTAFVQINVVAQMQRDLELYANQQSQSNWQQRSQDTSTLLQPTRRRWISQIYNCPYLEGTLILAFWLCPHVIPTRLRSTMQRTLADWQSTVLQRWLGIYGSKRNFAYSTRRLRSNQMSLQCNLPLQAFLSTLCDRVRVHRSADLVALIPYNPITGEMRLEMVASSRPMKIPSPQPTWEGGILRTVLENGEVEWHRSGVFFFRARLSGGAGADSTFFAVALKVRKQISEQYAEAEYPIGVLFVDYKRERRHFPRGDRPEVGVFSELRRTGYATMPRLPSSICRSARALHGIGWTKRPETSIRV